jgi:hypothetical protein
MDRYIEICVNFIQEARDGAQLRDFVNTMKNIRS